MLVVSPLNAGWVIVRGDGDVGEEAHNPSSLNLGSKPILIGDPQEGVDVDERGGVEFVDKKATLPVVAVPPTA